MIRGQTHPYVNHGSSADIRLKCPLTSLSLTVCSLLPSPYAESVPALVSQWGETPLAAWQESTNPVQLRRDTWTSVSHTVISRKTSQTAFANRHTQAYAKPACCWRITWYEGGRVLQTTSTTSIVCASVNAHVFCWCVGFLMKNTE